MRTLMDERDEDGNGLTLPQLQDNIITLVYAGIDTTALPLTTAFMKMAKYPEVGGNGTQRRHGHVAYWMNTLSGSTHLILELPFPSTFTLLVCLWVTTSAHRASLLKFSQ